MADVTDAAGARPATVRLVLVSHSRALAEGAVELAAQMAPQVVLTAAGGTDDGGIGTSFDRVTAALEAATADGGSAVVLTDLGSAVLTTEAVLEFLDEDAAERVVLADAPFVEGAVAAAVAANGGAGLEGVVAAAEGAAATFAGAGLHGATAGPPAADAAPAGVDGTTGGDDDVLRSRLVLRNPLGLHARPAAVLSRLVATFDAHVTVNGVDAASVLQLMQLGAAGGQELAVEAHGPQARAALDAVTAEVEAGFGEV